MLTTRCAVDREARCIFPILSVAVPRSEEPLGFGFPSCVPAPVLLEGVPLPDLAERSCVREAGSGELRDLRSFFMSIGENTEEESSDAPALPRAREGLTRFRFS